MFTQALRQELPQFEFETPKGGMFIYGSLEGYDTFELVYECMNHKVVYVPANQFYLDNRVSSEIRFNYTYSTKEQIFEGVRRIAETIKS